jgi:DNA-binding MarR family transcriptional regulator
MTLSDQETLQINQALFSITHAYEARMLVENPPEKTGMTVFDCAVLMVIGQCNPIQSSELARRMNVKPSTISIYIKRLMNKNLVRMERDEKDRRAWWLHLTNPGKIAYRMVIKGTVQYTRDFLASLDEEEAKTLHELLHKLSHSLGFTWQ